MSSALIPLQSPAVPFLGAVNGGLYLLFCELWYLFHFSFTIDLVSYTCSHLSCRHPVLRCHTGRLHVACCRILQSRWEFLSLM